MFDEKLISSKVETYREDFIDTLFKLIEIPTINPPGEKYHECVEYLSSLLTSWDIDHKIIKVSTGEPARFLIIGSYGDQGEALHFHGHYDVVPAQDTEQFRPFIEDGRVYGRGSSDMKSGLVAMLYAIRIIKELGLSLKGRITFSIVPDEETGGKLGTYYLFENRILPFESTIGMIMPEPTSGVIWYASKGALTYKIEVKGKTAHVALAHQGKNAFEYMIRIADSILDLNKKINERITDIPVNPPDVAGSIILIGGESGSGVNFNIVPDHAFFTIDRRFNPEEKLIEVKKELDDILDFHRKEGIEINQQIIQEGESSISDTENRLAKILKKSIADIRKRDACYELCPGLIEIRYFNKHKIPSFAFGPGLLEISHGPGEYVFVKDIIDCIKIYVVTIIRMLLAE